MPLLPTISPSVELVVAAITTVVSDADTSETPSSSNLPPNNLDANGKTSEIEKRTANTSFPPFETPVLKSPSLEVE